jgi:hypothetical protein
VVPASAQIGLVYQFQPGSGPAGTQITFAGGGCPRGSGAADGAFEVFDGADTSGSVLSSTPFVTDSDDSFHGTTAPLPAGQVGSRATHVVCSSNGTSSVGSDFTLTAGTASTTTAPTTSTPGGSSTSSSMPPTSTTTTIPAARQWIDTSDRAAVLSAFHAIFDPTVPAPGWNGNVNDCVPGSLAADHRAAVMARVNWYRGMAGVLTGVTEDAGFSANAQQGALITAANSALNHNPPSTAKCFTNAGLDGTSHSNLYLGLSGVASIDGWVADPGSNNTAVGHRAWMLDPAQARMGFGSIPAAPQAAALYVVDQANSFPAVPPPTRESTRFVSWPTRGFVPATTVYPRWSLHRGGADFSSASVVVTVGGDAVPTTVEHRGTGDRLSTLTFLPQLPSLPTDSDLPISVTVTGISGTSVPGSYSWTTTVVPVAPPTPPPPPTTGGGDGRVAAINSCLGGHVKEGFLTNAFSQQLNCGDARAIALAGTRVGVVNSCGASYVKQGALSSSFDQQTGCNDTAAIAVSANRNGVINGCGAAYVKEGPLNGGFNQQLNCGDARALAVTDNRVGVINSCGSFYVKEGALNGGFNQQLNCNDARAIAVSANRIAVINSCGAVYVKEGALSNPFQLQLNCGDGRAIAVTDNRLGVINSCCAYYVKEGALSGGFTQQTQCGDAKAIAVSTNRNAVINGCSALYVKEGPLNGPFSFQLGCNDAKAVSLN